MPKVCGGGGGGSSHGVVAKVLDFWLEEREFHLQSRYFVQFRTNTQRKWMSSFILPAIG